MVVVLVEFFKALFLINLFGIIIYQVDDDYTLSLHVKQQVKLQTSWRNQILTAVAYFGCLVFKEITSF